MCVYIFKTLSEAALTIKAQHSEDDLFPLSFTSSTNKLWNKSLDFNNLIQCSPLLSSSSLCRAIGECISHSHITLGGEHSVHNGLNSHPAKRELPICGLDVDIILSGQTKVRDLQHLVLPHQHIPAGKVSVDNAQLRQELLLREKRRGWRCFIFLAT